MSLQELIDKATPALCTWINERIDDLLQNEPKLAVTSIYLKRGAKNYLIRENEKISKMINNAALFICDEKGNVDTETIFDDLIAAFRAMEETQFDFGGMHGTIGKGIVRVALPDNPFLSFLFGNIQAIKITHEDFAELKELFVED